MVDRTRKIKTLKRKINGLSDSISKLTQADLLADKEATLQNLLETAGVGVISADLDGRIRFINETACQWLGYSRTELVGKPFLDFLHADDSPIVVEIFLNALNGARTNPTLQFRAICKDRQIKWFLTNPTPIISSGCTVGFNAILHDMTERMLVEEALLESEKRYRLLADHTADFVILLDMNLNGVYHSPSILKRTGFNEQEMKQLPIERHIAPESLKLIGKISVEELSKVQYDHEYNPVINMEIEYYCKDGTTFWAENNFTVVRDENGRPIYILGEGRDITELRRAFEKIKESEEKFRAISELSTDVVYMTDSQGKIVYISPSAELVFGYSAEEMVGHNFTEFSSPDSIEIAMSAFSDVISNENKLHNIELRAERKDGRRIIIDLNSAFLKLGDFIGTSGIIRDITQRKQIEQALQESEVKFRLLAENASDVIWTMDLGMRVTYVSPSVYSFQGYTPVEAMALPLAVSVTPESLQQIINIFQDGIRDETTGHSTPDTVYTFEAEFVRKDGSKFWTETKASFMRIDTGKAIGIIGITRDINERKLMQQQLIDLATRDSLTGLPNRTLFYDRLSFSIAQAKRKGNKLAVMLLDLDRFKNVNDTMGHGAGDELLKAFGAKLNNRMRASDTVARMGGDEYIVLLTDITDINKVIEVAQRIQEDLKRPLITDKYEFNISASIGIAIYPQDGKDHDELLRKADIAMYTAKKEGRGRYCLYSYAEKHGQQNL